MINIAGKTIASGALDQINESGKNQTLMTKVLLSSLALVSLLTVTPALAEKPLSTSRSHWTGHYEPLSFGASHIKELTILQEKDGSLSSKVEIVLDKQAEDAGPLEISLDVRPEAYRDSNKKSIDDTLVISLPASRFKPLIVIEAGEPHSPRNTEHYKYVTYKCYLHGYRGGSYISGRLDRTSAE